MSAYYMQAYTYVVYSSLLSVKLFRKLIYRFKKKKQLIWRQEHNGSELFFLTPNETYGK